MQTTNVRVIAATNKDLWDEVNEGNFREDLYYRLDTVKIKLPPLRDRQEDVVPIFRKFVNEFSSRYDSVFKGFSDEARDLLISYRWPGNVRELRNVAEQLVVLEKSQFIDKERLQKYLKGRQHRGSADNLPVVAPKQQKDEESDDFSSASQDPTLIYRALVEMRTDLSDLKKMLAKFIYSSFSNKEIKALPEAMPRDFDPNDISVYTNKQGEESLGIRSMDTEDTDEEDDEPSIDSFFTEDEIPSIEKAEKFLIQQALKKFEGNRRKASEALGVSERTLYRKLDQYELQ